MSDFMTNNTGAFWIVRVLAGRVSQPKPPWRRLVFLLLASAVFAGLFMPREAKADPFTPSNDPPLVATDKVAHAGVSYIIQTSCYAVFAKGFGIRDRALATGMCFGLTMVATTYKEFLDPTVDTGDIIANGVGAAAASFTILQFDF